MKKNLLFLLFLLFLIIGISPAQAQSQELTLNFENTPLSEVIKSIEKNSNYTFFINEAHIDLTTKVSIHVANEGINAVLNKIFSNTPYLYTLKNRQILVSRKAESTPSLESGKLTVSGVITDMAGNKLPGASVVVAGTSLGVTSALDGAFSIAVPNPNVSLVISYLGYEQKTIPLAGKTHLTVKMEEDAAMMGEVVVVGYGTQTKKTLTGAVSVVNMNDVETSSVTNISQALAGKAAGLAVRQMSAQPGGGSKLRIRGEASTGAGNEPLIVIDGFPVSSVEGLGSGTVYSAGTVDNMLESMNPDDIESITVLKDAASTAIYGSRAGHGVILITTKRGAEQKAKVTYSGNASVNTIASQYQMLTGSQFMDIYNRQTYENYLKNNGLSIYKGYIPTPDVIPAFVAPYSNDQILRARNTDWLDEVTRMGYMHQHNLSVVGGSQKTKYLLSANYMDQAGIVENNNASRLTFRLNLDQDISSWIKVGVTATYTQNKYDNVPLGDGTQENSGILTTAIQANPTLAIRDSQGKYVIDNNRPFVPNPVSLLDIQDKTVKDRFLGMAYVSVEPVKNLIMKLNVGADRKFEKRSNYLPKTTLLGQIDNGSANIRQQDGTDLLLDATATYNVTFAEKHKLTALLGYSYQQFNNSSVAAGNRDFITDALLWNDLSAGAYAKPPVGSSRMKSAMASGFVRLHYNYLNRYLLEGTVRMDASSNFTKENRIGYFPSISAAWLLTEENFMKNSRDWLSYLKFRVSYGQTGNSNIGYHIYDMYGIGSPSIIGKDETEIKGVALVDYGNKDLTWETTTEYNVGLDVKFFGDRLSISAEYFYRKITDILGTIPLLSHNEVRTMYANVGATQSRGVEVTLNSVNIDHKKFRWSTSLTLANYKDRWLERNPYWKPEPYEGATDYIRARYSTLSMGIMRPGDVAPKGQPTLLPGMVMLQNLNDDDKIDNNDKVYVGNNDPSLIFGFGNTFNYRNFDLNLYFYGELGRLRGGSYLDEWTRMANGENVSVRAYDVFSHRNVDSEYPTTINNADGWGDYFTKKVNFIRCGSITLGYTIPVKKKVISNLRVYATVTNPFVMTNWNGLDPETDNDSYSYPNIRSFNFGVNLTF